MLKFVSSNMESSINTKEAMQYPVILGHYCVILEVNLRGFGAVLWILDILCKDFCNHMKIELFLKV